MLTFREDQSFKELSVLKSGDVHCFVEHMLFKLLKISFFGKRSRFHSVSRVSTYHQGFAGDSHTLAHFLKKNKVRGVLSQDTKLYLAWHDLLPGLNSSMPCPVSDFALQESQLWELPQNFHLFSP